MFQVITNLKRREVILACCDEFVRSDRARFRWFI